jgi:hypothetical protein
LTADTAARKPAFMSAGSRCGRRRQC